METVGLLELIGSVGGPLSVILACVVVILWNDIKKKERDIVRLVKVNERVLYVAERLEVILNKLINK